MFTHRVARNRAAYFTFLFCVLALFGYLVTNYHWELYQLLLMALLCLVPGRLVQYFWRDLFAGRKCLNRKKIDDAISHFEKFLDHIRKFPSIKWLVFFSYGLYSFRVEAIALTYLGIGYLHKRDFARADGYFIKALEIDTKTYSVALFNQAVAFTLRQDQDNARRCLTDAQSHGYPKISFEEFVANVQDEFNRP